MSGNETGVIKVKRIACKSLKGRGINTFLRVIYVSFPDEQRIVFVVLYYKIDEESEDRERIKFMFHIYRQFTFVKHNGCETTPLYSDDSILRFPYGLPLMAILSGQFRTIWLPCMHVSIA